MPVLYYKLFNKIQAVITISKQAMQTYDQKQKQNSFKTEKWWYQKCHCKCSRQFCLQLTICQLRQLQHYLYLEQDASIKEGAFKF